MEEMTKHGKVGLAAMKAGMDRKTARKYVAAGSCRRRWWRRVMADARGSVRGALARGRGALGEDAALEAKTLFELLSSSTPIATRRGNCARYSGACASGARRRSGQGGDRSRNSIGPGRPRRRTSRRPRSSASRLPASSSCTCSASSCCRSPTGFGRRSACRSRWRPCARACSGPLPTRSRASLPPDRQLHGGDAPHPRRQEACSSRDGKRPFNDDYLALMRHFGMTPRTTAVGAKEQNGDVEASNGVIKRRLEQLCWCEAAATSRTATAWQSFIDEALRKANAGAQSARRARTSRRCASSTSRSCPSTSRKTSWSASGAPCGVKHCAYSVPSRLIGQMLRVRVFEDRIEAYFAGNAMQLACERLAGAICTGSTTGT